MRKRVYIAGPISKGDVGHNVVQAARAAAELIQHGFSPLCPQLTTFMHYWTDETGFFTRPKVKQWYPDGRYIDHDTWMDVDLPWVAVSDAVLRLPGESLGADIEVQYAQDNGIPVVYSIDELSNGERWTATEQAEVDRMVNECGPCLDREPHETFATGSVRDTREGKGRFDLISPIALQRLAVHFENGAKKYGDRNWEKGQPLQRFIDSALRHVNNYQLGKRDEDHLIAAAWNLLACVHVEAKIDAGELPPELR